MAIGLSTSWNASGHTGGTALLAQIKELGFDRVELSYNLTPAMVQDIEEAVGRREIEVTSVHNYCPIPDGFTRKEALPDCRSLSSLDEEERAQAVKYTKISIDTALRLGAKAVVLHSGRAEMEDATRRLIALLAGPGMSCAEFLRTRDAMIKERAQRARPFFENALRSLDTLDAYARGKNILLGVENRFYYREIPSFEEIGLILARFKGSSLRYWHDIGHAQLMENLGLARHKEYLERYGSSTAGTHLHDISGGDDHRAPGKGDFDFSQLVPFLSQACIKVMEVHKPATAQDIRDGAALLKRTFNE